MSPPVGHGSCRSAIPGGSPRRHSTRSLCSPRSRTRFSATILAERAYDTVAIVRDATPTLTELRRRLDALSELLGLDRERMRLWGLVKSLAWDNPDEAQLFSEVGST